MSRSILRSLLDRTVQHYHPTYTADASGARTPSYATVANADVPAAIWPVAYDPVMAAAFDRADIVCDHVILTDSDLGAKAKDKVTNGDDEYLVNGVMAFRNSMVANVTVYCMGATKRTV